MGLKWIVSFLVILGFWTFISIYLLKRFFFSESEKVTARLNEESTKLQQKQVELNQKLKEAEDDLNKKRAEARALADKMRSDAEQESKHEREKIIAQARIEGEEVIAKAQNAKDKLKNELEKEIDVKAINYAMKILGSILSENAKGIFNDTLIEEYIENLKSVDMSKISNDVQTVEVITLNDLGEKFKKQLAEVIKQKLKREISLNNKVDAQLGGGMIVKFGSMALDGSIKNLMREEIINLQKEVEARTS